MPIPVRCQCGQSFQAKDALGGKTVKCPKCGQPILIPSPTPPAGSSGGLGDLFDEIGLAPPVEGPKCPYCHESVKPGAVICVSCGTNMQTGERLTTQFGDDDQQAPGGQSFGNRDLDRAARNIDEDKEMQEALGQGAPWWIYLVSLIAICSFITAMLLIPKSMVMFVSAILLIIAGVVMNLVGWIFISIDAFGEGTSKGILCLLFWPYMLYYVFTHWDDVGSWFLILVVGNVIQGVGGAFWGVAGWLAEDKGNEFGLMPNRSPTAITTSIAVDEWCIASPSCVA